ncbi:hypothetical protein ECANGB1_1628 [Enterospora canceri]|uniref:Uncharacterized protein n=1 Tax=Enterospora canceri TaxID=1081671 RepID=A0A1Y1S6S4_9MICR|nr:hypothetical protein ECANGB1_1628 [Enterospora canceri]
MGRLKHKVEKVIEYTKITLSEELETKKQQNFDQLKTFNETLTFQDRKDAIHRLGIKIMMNDVSTDDFDARIKYLKIIAERLSEMKTRVTMEKYETTVIRCINQIKQPMVDCLVKLGCNLIDVKLLAIMIAHVRIEAMAYLRETKPSRIVV